MKKIFKPYNSEYKVKGKVVKKGILTKDNYLFIKYNNTVNAPLEVQHGTNKLTGDLIECTEKDYKELSNKLKYLKPIVISLEGRFKGYMFTIPLHRDLSSITIINNKEER